MTPATTQMNLGIVLNEISQVKRATIILHLYEIPRIDKSVEMESRPESVREEGKGHGVSTWDDEDVLD